MRYIVQMGSRQSAEVTRALKLVASGVTPYAAAKKVGIALSTIYRALKRQRLGSKK
jgi:transposase